MSGAPLGPCLDPAAANAFLSHAFLGEGSDRPVVTIMQDGFSVIELDTDHRHARPGDMVSGPTQMALADTVAYLCIFTKIGITPMAVTSSLNINFLRPCIGPKVRAEGTLVKIGRTLAVIDVRIYGAGSAKPAGLATVTYSLPQAEI